MATRGLSLSSILAPFVPRIRPGGTVPSAPAGPGTGTLVPAGDAVALPVTIGGVRVRQTDRTTCGSTVLLMLAATGDPVLARWLEDGTLPADLPRRQVPPEIPDPLPVGGGVAERLAAAQHRVKSRTSRRGIGSLAWPPALGTPPWTAAREARFPGVTYRHLPLDDAGDAGRDLLASARRATLAGVPVPLYTGGNVETGLTTAVPRHVVLAVPPPRDAPHRGYDGAGAPVLHLYEPARGLVHRVRLADLLARRTPHPALGGWTHVVWALLPVPTAEAVARRAVGRQAGQDPSYRSEEER